MVSVSFYRDIPELILSNAERPVSQRILWRGQDLKVRINGHFEKLLDRFEFEGCSVNGSETRTAL